METGAEKWFEDEGYHEKNFRIMWNEAKKRMSKLEDIYKEGNVFNWKEFFNEIKNMDQTEADKYTKEKLKYMKLEDLFTVRACVAPIMANEAEKKKFGFTYSIE